MNKKSGVFAYLGAFEHTLRLLADHLAHSEKTVIVKDSAWHYKNDDALEQSHDILLCDKSDILCKRCSKEEREYVSQSFTITWPSSEILHFNHHYDKIRVILCTY